MILAGWRFAIHVDLPLTLGKPLHLFVCDFADAARTVDARFVVFMLTVIGRDGPATSEAEFVVANGQSMTDRYATVKDETLSLPLRLLL